MDSNRFYSIPFNAIEDSKMKKLRKRQGGIIAFGRWQALLGFLYDEDGLIRASDPDTWEILKDLLEFKSQVKAEKFFQDLAELGLISLASWEADRTVFNEGVFKELEWRKKKRADGSKGGRPRKQSKNQVVSETDET